MTRFVDFRNTRSRPKTDSCHCMNTSPHRHQHPRAQGSIEHHG
jgi:hypothetical protein